MSVAVIVGQAIIGAIALTAFSAPAADRIKVKVLDRNTSENQYTNVIPAHTSATSNTDVNCADLGSNINCNGTTRTTATTTPARHVGYGVTGAVLSLQLPDGRTAVVGCESKYAPKGDYVNRRSCRIPLVDDIEAEFSGDKAKLFWPVSIDGKKLASETYKVMAIKPAK